MGICNFTFNIVEKETLFDLLTELAEALENVESTQIHPHRLALILSALALTFRATPSHEIQMRIGSHFSPELTKKMCTLSCTLFGEACAALFLRDRYEIDTLEGIQAGCFLLYDSHAPVSKQQVLYGLLLQSTRRMGFDRITDTPDGSDKGKRTESAVRCWWSLVHRSWMMSIENGYYDVHHQHFSTRFPVCTDSERFSQWTELSYASVMIKLGSTLRDTLDMIKTSTAPAYDDVFNTFDTFMWEVPLFYRPQTSDIAAAIEPVVEQEERVKVERWTFVQALFSSILRLFDIDSLRNTNDSPYTSFFCLRMARYVLDMDAEGRHMCRLLDDLQAPWHNCFCAVAIVLACALDKAMGMSHVDRRRAIEQAISHLEDFDTSSHLHMLDRDRCPAMLSCLRSIERLRDDHLARIVLGQDPVPPSVRQLDELIKLVLRRPAPAWSVNDGGGQRSSWLDGMTSAENKQPSAVRSTAVTPSEPNRLAEQAWQWLNDNAFLPGLAAPADLRSPPGVNRFPRLFD